MTLTIEIGLVDEQTRFRLPEAVAARLQDLQNRHAALTAAERAEAQGLASVVELLTLVRLRAESAEEVLTLNEAAAYLRVREAELQRLAEARDVPAQSIGGEWRFLKRALAAWLCGGHVVKRGSKQAVLRHFGIFKSEGDLEEALSRIHEGRRAADG